MSQASDKVNIRPKVSILSVLKYLEYETWYALAEFVDNSIASFLQNKDTIEKGINDTLQLEVKIDINDQENKIVISDNAAGILEKDFPRAFRAAEAPIEKNGLSEFGMGMKSAACWFADKWTVTTKPFNESYKKVVRFDLRKIVEDSLEELEVEKVEAKTKDHYTRIELIDVNRMPRRKGITKVKNHLASIYREFIRNGTLILKVNNDELVYSEPTILTSPKFDDPNGKQIYWKRDINFPLDQGLSVHGFVAIREKASTAEAGFALFRRGRVIEGSFDNGFRPEYIFGNPNSFRFQRVFGELHLEGFDVSFTKKGIKWDENLDVFLKCLRDEITHDDFPLLQQAERYRVRATDQEYQRAKKILDETVNDLENNAERALEIVRSAEPLVNSSENLSKSQKVFHRTFEIRFNRVTWRISIELSYDPSLKDLIEIGDHLLPDNKNDIQTRRISIRLSLIHPFMVKYVGVDNSKIEPILRFAAALGLSEVVARESGAKTQGEIRRNFNELISNLSNSQEKN